MRQTPDISVVLPVYEEQDNIGELFRRLTETLSGICRSHELIFVDDGSRDETFTRLEALYREHPDVVRVVRFSRNFGQHPAIIAGLRLARGNAIVVMDSDLQDRPEEIPKLYGKLNEGYDCVYGIRQSRKIGLLKRITSGLFWSLFSRIVRLEIPKNQGALRMFSRQFTDAFLPFSEYAPFIAGISAWTGFRQATVEVEQGERVHGTTHYSYYKMLRLTWTATTTFSKAPLRWITYLGLLASSGAIGAACFYAVRQAITGMSVTGWTSLIVAVFFMSGVQLLVLGVIAEYLARVISQTNKRPLYIVQETLRPADNSQPAETAVRETVPDDR